MFDWLAKLRPDNFVDMLQTAVLLYAIWMVRQAFREGVKLLRQNLDHIRRIEARLDALERDAQQNRK